MGKSSSKWALSATQIFSYAFGTDYRAAQKRNTPTILPNFRPISVIYETAAEHASGGLSKRTTSTEEEAVLQPVTSKKREMPCSAETLPQDVSTDCSYQERLRAPEKYVDGIDTKLVGFGSSTEQQEEVRKANPCIILTSPVNLTSFQTVMKPTATDQF
jgi:hypothetical protein